MNDNWKYVPFGQLFEWGEKSKIKSGDGKATGKYKMFVCSDTEIKRYDDYLETGESLVFGTGGKASCHYINENFAYSTDCVIAQKISGDINTKFYYYYFRQNRLGILQSTFSGSGLQHTSKKKIEKILVPILDYDEQQRIVSRIEELFSQLDSGVETLKKTKEQLKVYRQAVLKEAFNKIDSYIYLHHISESRLGKMLDKSKNIGISRKYLRNINVRWFSFDLSNLLEMKIEDSEIEKYSIQKNDLVICEGGEPGRCAVWEKGESIFYQKALHRVRFSSNSNPKFYMYYLWLSAQTGKLTKYYTGTGIKHLTGQSLSKVPVPKTDYDTQNKIVSKIESRLSVCDSIEKTIDKSLQEAEALRQSILKQAFEGVV